MKNKSKLWQPHEAICEHCKKIGTKTYFNEKYLHVQCKKERRLRKRRNSEVRVKIVHKLETRIYLARVNKHIVTKKRNCLICKQEFLSEGNYNRVCEKCNIMMENNKIYIIRVYKNHNHNI